MNENQINNNFLQKQAWDYFQLHAAQRLTTFNFYIVISSVIITALFSTFQKDYQFYGVGVILGLLLIFISFIFWKLDGRNKELIKMAEVALRFFEADIKIQDSVNELHIAKIFSRENYETNKKRSKNKKYICWANHFSYSDCFNLVFSCFTLVGILGIFIGLKNLI